MTHRSRLAFGFSFASSIAFSFFLLPTTLQAQVQAFSPGIRDRAVTRIVYFDPSQRSVAGEVNIAFGRPAWKAEYADQLDRLKGRLWRLGADFWTVLDTNLPLRIAGTEVAPGLHYLSARRGSDGGWELVLIDAPKARMGRLDASEVLSKPEAVPISSTAPLEMKKLEAPVEKLEIVLKIDAQDISKGTLRIAWGNFELTAPLEIEAPKAG